MVLSRPSTFSPTPSESRNNSFSGRLVHSLYTRMPDQQGDKNEQREELNSSRTKYFEGIVERRADVRSVPDWHHHRARPIISIASSYRQRGRCWRCHYKHNRIYCINTDPCAYWVSPTTQLRVKRCEGGLGGPGSLVRHEIVNTSSSRLLILEMCPNYDNEPECSPN